MDLYFIVLIMVTIIVVLYMWYVTRWKNYISDSEPLHLEGEENNIISNWYKLYSTAPLDMTLDDINIAVKYLAKVHNLNIFESEMVVGNDLDIQYYEKTGKKLSLIYRDDLDCIFDLRTELGKNIEIAVIRDTKIRKKLYRDNTLHISEINRILDSDIAITAKRYMKSILDERWDKIKKVNSDGVVNTYGSYLYLKSDFIYGDIITAESPYGKRINLLCSDLDFEIFLNRWKSNENEINRNTVLM